MAEPQYLTIPHLNRDELSRIFSKVSVDPLAGCWNWTAALNTYGYGCIWYHGRQEIAHRLVYAWLVGPLPMKASLRSKHGPVLDHGVCDNRRCCNPAHTALTTNAENTGRGGCVSAVNRRKSHCKHGHPLPDAPNRPDGYVDTA